jgi:hypothetical protein
LSKLSAKFCVGCLLFACTAFAADTSESPEAFHIEVTGSGWLVNSGGTIQASGSPINLATDLGVYQQQPTFYGRLIFKPGRKHRIIVEGTPFFLQGQNTVDRTVTYRGDTFNVSQTLISNADFNYAFAGYQYDLLSGSMGHLGLSVGGAYLNADGTIRALQTGITATKSETVGLPLAGVEGRVFPIRRHRILEFDGGLRGMDFDGYGHYLEAGANAGVTFGPITLQAGYRSVRVDILTTSANPSGVDALLRGPLFSAQWRW